MFMHGGFWHIFFNMYSLYIFGKAVEQIIGRQRFTILYFAAGFAAAAAQLGVQALDPAIQGVPTVGASGCVYGVIVAFAMIFPEARLTLIFPPVTLSAKWMAIIFIGIELFTGVTGTQAGVAHFAHLGGALIGWLLIWWWYKRNKNNNNRSYVHY
jgi:membrane associated rhomboid family serine protease